MDARLNMVMPVLSLHGWQGGSRKPAGCMPEATRDHLHSGVHTYLGRYFILCTIAIKLLYIHHMKAYITDLAG